MLYEAIHGSMLIRSGCFVCVRASRCGHSSVVVGDKMYTFGGSNLTDDDVTEYYNDLHILRCKKGQYL